MISLGVTLAAVLRTHGLRTETRRPVKNYFNNPGGKLWKLELGW